MEALGAALNKTKQAFPQHPYYPVEAEILGYIANEYSVPQLLLAFGCGCVAILSITCVAAKRIRGQMPMSELLTIVWFVLSKSQERPSCGSADRYSGGCIHFFFEGILYDPTEACEDPF